MPGSVKGTPVLLNMYVKVCETALTLLHLFCFILMICSFPQQDLQQRVSKALAVYVIEQEPYFC